jgi:hypothetical protein
MSDDEGVYTLDRWDMLDEQYVENPLSGDGQIMFVDIDIDVLEYTFVNDTDTCLSDWWIMWWRDP